MNINTNSYFYFIRKMLPQEMSNIPIQAEYVIQDAVITDDDTDTDFETESESNSEYELKGMHYDYINYFKFTLYQKL